MAKLKFKKKNGKYNSVGRGIYLECVTRTEDLLVSLNEWVKGF